MTRSIVVGLLLVCSLGAAEPLQDRIDGYCTATPTPDYLCSAVLLTKGEAVVYEGAFVMRTVALVF